MVNTDFKKYTEERDYLKQEIGNLKYDIAQLTRQNQMLKADNQKLMNNTTDRFGYLHSHGFGLPIVNQLF